VDVGVAGDKLTEAYLTQVAGHNVALLCFNAKLKDIGQYHQKVSPLVHL